MLGHSSYKEALGNTNQLIKRRFGARSPYFTQKNLKEQFESCVWATGRSPTHNFQCSLLNHLKFNKPVLSHVLLITR